MPQPARKAYAIVTRRHDGDDVIDLNRIEPFTADGRKELVRQINRPAGERVEVVMVTVLAR